MRLYLISDLKFLFTMMGRDGYSVLWCIYCVLKQSQWTAIHGDNDEGKCNCEADLWTIEKLHGVAMIQMQKDALDRTYESSGIREIPYWNFIPVTRVIVPILHLLLGLENVILDSFWEWIDVRAEKLTLEEVEARQMTMLAELTLDKEVDKLKDAKIDLEFLVVERKIINDSLKTRGLAPTNCAAVTTDKTTIVAEEKQLQSKQIKLEKDVKQLRAAFVTTTKIETDVRKAHGRREKALQMVLNNMFKGLFCDSELISWWRHGG
jgi:hypothetical protein